MAEQQSARFSLKSLLVYVTWVAVCLGGTASYMRYRDLKVSPSFIYFMLFCILLAISPNIILGIAIGIVRKFRRYRLGNLKIPCKRLDKFPSSVFYWIPFLSCLGMIFAGEAARSRGQVLDLSLFWGVLAFLSFSSAALLCVLSLIVSIGRHAVFSKKGLQVGFFLTPWNDVTQITWSLSKTTWNLTFSIRTAKDFDLQIQEIHRHQIENFLEEVLHHPDWIARASESELGEPKTEPIPK